MEKYIAKKKYGQNFIKDTNILYKITNSLPIKENDLVIEIGLGQGDLTKTILEKKSFFIGYEIDKELAVFLDNFQSSKTKIIFKDFLKTNIKEDFDNIEFDKLYVISNLPYYITTPIITKIIKEQIPVDSMILMMQKEVANRFCASPGYRDYGSVTVFLNYYFDIVKLFPVNRKSFTPEPNVDSQVVMFKRKEKLLQINNFETFEKLLRDSFQFKRKTIKNNLHDYDINTLSKILENHGLNLSSRAEEMPLEVFVDLANNIISK